MEYIGIFVLVTFSIVLGETLSNLVTPMVIKRLGIGQQPQPTPSTIPDIMNHLNILVDSEFVAVVEVPNMIKNIQLISDFEKVQTEITKNVLNGLSTAFFIKVNMAGLKKDYIITYVTRRTNAKILNYINEHNFTLKK